MPIEQFSNYIVGKINLRFDEMMMVSTFY